jgi:hypothetical protein
LIGNVQDKKIWVLDKKEKMVISRQDKAARKLHDYPPIQHGAVRVTFPCLFMSAKFYLQMLV